MDKQALIDALNQDLAAEYAAIIQYAHYAAKVRGPWRSELRSFFQAEIPDEQLHAQYLADKIAALGGTPAAEPSPVKVVAEAKQMLQVALEAEVETIDRYVRRRKQAEEVGEHGLAAQFDDIISDETNHRDELQQMLARWPGDSGAKK